MKISDFLLENVEDTISYDHLIVYNFTDVCITDKPAYVLQCLILPLVNKRNQCVSTVFAGRHCRLKYSMLVCSDELLDEFQNSERIEVDLPLKDIAPDLVYTVHTRTRVKTYVDVCDMIGHYNLIKRLISNRTIDKKISNFKKHRNETHLFKCDVLDILYSLIRLEYAKLSNTITSGELETSAWINLYLENLRGIKGRDLLNNKCLHSVSHLDGKLFSKFKCNIDPDFGKNNGLRSGTESIENCANDFLSTSWMWKIVKNQDVKYEEANCVDRVHRLLNPEVGMLIRNLQWECNKTANGMRDTVVALRNALASFKITFSNFKRNDRIYNLQLVCEILEKNPERKKITDAFFSDHFCRKLAENVLSVAMKPLSDVDDNGPGGVGIYNMIENSQLEFATIDNKLVVFSDLDVERLLCAPTVDYIFEDKLSAYYALKALQ